MYKVFMITVFGLMTLAVLVLSPLSVQAQFDPIKEACQGESANSDVCQSCVDNAQTTANECTNPVSGNEGIILRVVNIISIVGGVAAVVMIITGGIKIILSGGDSNRVKSGRETLIFAVVGIIVIAVARPIIIFIINRT